MTVNGVTEPLQPDPNESAHQNNLLGSVELTVAAPSGWQHRLTGFDYLYRYTDNNLNNTDPFTYDTYQDLYDDAHQPRGIRISGRLFGADLGA